jgi:hypothetical protein
MTTKSKAAPMSEREWRRRYITMLQVDVGLLDPPDASGRMRRPTPKSSAARKRVVELLCLEAGEPPPVWKGTSRGKGEPIDDSPWRDARRASANRLAVHGLALDADRRALYCTACLEVLATFPRGRHVRAMGTTPSLLAAWHQAKGCS